jgi:hypothetical protein
MQSEYGFMIYTVLEMSILITNEEKIKTNELFYSLLHDKNDYDMATQKCIEDTVIDLIHKKTNNNHPGMLLGKIQSGKTRTFIGVTGLAFDNNYDVAIVLTKGTKALAYQTYERLKDEFNVFVEDDYLQIFDIMNLPDNLAQYELDQKLIFIVKKETNNLKRLDKALNQTYPELKNKRTLIIDDEADYASIGFKKTDREIYEINRIAGQIDLLRQTIKDSSFLQVTATPYSLYLQPDSNIELSGYTFKPIKPAFTHLVPHGSNYVGGGYYFQESQDDSSIAFHLHNPIDDDELQILKKSDRRRFKIEEALKSNRVKSLRDAVVNFLVGGIIRRKQDENRRLRKSKYSFIIHTEQRQASHQWQEEIVTAIIDQLTLASEENPLYFQRLVKDAYDRLSLSLNILGVNVPFIDDIQYLARESLQRGHVMITKVNSEKDVNELLDDTGQLKLRVPFNIFIGGQILDRGITISNLIGFYYGRNPLQYQQDTVLQHSRMFGYRPKEDLAVTRFYTTSNLYQVMGKINDFDTALRNAITNQNNNSVVFIQRDNKNNIVPCNPNKIILSKLTSLKAHKRLLPVGMQTYSKTKIRQLVNEIDDKVDYLIRDDMEKLIDLEDASNIISMINDTFDSEKGEEWDVKSFISSIEYLSKNATEDQNKVWLIVRKKRNINRIRKSSGRYEDAPDTPKGENSELRMAKELAQDIPALILLREEGDEEKGWRGSPFWWPVLVTPASTQPVVFARETIEK